MMLRTKPREAHPGPAPETNSPLGDLRFRNLLAKEEWAALPQAIRRRFSKRVSNGRSVVYAGEVVETKLSAVGRLFAEIARAVGGPLPLSEFTHTPAVVTVTEDRKTGGQIWTRVYARERGFPQVIHSSKQFAGPTGLEEYVGSGVSMALVVHEENGALVFRSVRYFLRVRRLRIPLPAWLTPGALIVTHAEEADAQFSFLLEIVHPIFGLVIRQLAVFREVSP